MRRVRFKLPTDEEEEERNLRIPPSDHGGTARSRAHRQEGGTSMAESLQQSRRAMADDDPTCRICGRNFRSMKSLYGHMKVHEREWKGINPPPEQQQEPVLERKPDHKDDANCSKSSSKRRKAHEHREYTEEEMSVISCTALHLLILAGGQWRPTREPVTTSADEGGKKKKMAEPVMAVDKGTAEAVEQLVVQPNTVPKQYPCTTCHRSFSSHQALGGHIAAHKEHKNSNKDQQNAQQQDEQQNQAAPARECMHRCDQCPMAFQTGQALGGHKRKHYVKKTEQENVTEPVINVAAQQKEHVLEH